MPRITRPLTPTEIKAAKPREKEYVIRDGDGLELTIKPTGSKLWRFRYNRPVTKKRNMMSLGSWPEVSLANARDKRKAAKALLEKGIDPQSHQQEMAEQAQIAAENTFSLVARQWWEVKKSQVSADYAADIWRSLERDVFPAVGNMPVHEIKARTLIAALEPVKQRGALETVRRLIQRINEVMVYAVNVGLVDANPASGIGKAFERPEKKHMPTIRPESLPELMKALSTASITLQTRCLIEWQLHTLVRPAEAAGARWDEIDLAAREWRVSAVRMKMSREHIIPLSDQTLSLLELLRPISGHREYLFPGIKDPRTPMHSQTANAALKRMGFGGKLVAHGLRSIASTAMNEQGFSPDVIEAALSHIDKNEVRKAYNRSTYLEQRRPLMSWWSAFIEQAAQGDISLAGGVRGLRAVAE